MCSCPSKEKKIDLQFSVQFCSEAKDVFSCDRQVVHVDGTAAPLLGWLLNSLETCDYVRNSSVWCSLVTNV